TQPNGDTLTVTLKGDEFLKFAVTPDGFTLLRDSENYFAYAQLNKNGDIEPSIFKAKAISLRSKEEMDFLRSIPKNLTFSDSQISIVKQVKKITELDRNTSRSFPTIGNRKLLCILMEYPDKPFQKTQADFDALFNQINYTTNGATGSVKDYFLEASYNQLNLTIDVVGPFISDYDYAHYGKDTSGGMDYFARDLIYEAVDKADPVVNYADYDNDNDGTVDGIYVIFAGYGQESGADANAIWSHAWSIFAYADGKEILKYSCSPELRGIIGSNITYIGVICHEFGHVLGAPDYYDTNYGTGGSYSGTGNWDLQASGSWNNGGKTPPHPNPRTKIDIYHWATATVLSTPATISLNPAYLYNNTFYQINTNTSGEYYLIENRQKRGFDSYIPGHGLIIYHAHSSIPYYDLNSTHPQRFYPVAANAPSAIPTSTSTSYGTINSASCPFPGTNNETSFSDTTIPAMQSWTGINTNKPITNINEINGIITFDFMGGAVNNPSNFIINSISATSINLSWTQYLNQDILLLYSTSPITDVPEAINYSTGTILANGAIVLYNGNSNSFNHLNLTPNTTYYYKIFSKTSAGPSWSIGTILNGTTPCNKVSALPYYQDFDNGGNFPVCFTQQYEQGHTNWQLGNYFGTTTNYFIELGDYGDDGITKLIFPTFDFTSNLANSVNLSFYYVSNGTSDHPSILKIYYKNSVSGSWNLLTTYNTSYNGTKIVTLPNLSSYYQIAFEGKAYYQILIDDIEIQAISSGNSTVNTLSATEITDSSAIINAMIQRGLDTISEAGFYFQTAGSLNWEYSYRPYYLNNYSLFIGDLSPNTT
ncbi:MAG: M6 family metalloprotease domain-containing protein, partial [Bacteroidales bacterium]